MSATLDLRGVSAGYGGAPVLEGMSLTVRSGTLTALLGPSGCGKTTTLRVVAGLVAESAGEIRLGGERLSGVPAEHRGIGFVFQKPLLFPHLSVADNVGFGLAMRGVGPAARRSAVLEALELVKLGGFGGRRPRELSGGQEQRVALARALVTRPRLLLLDEPLSALDEHLRRDMRALVSDVQRRLGITTVLVTHDQQEALELADRVALVLGGRVAQEGAPRDFHTEPASADVARFFGWCVLHGSWSRGEFRTAAGAVPLPSAAREATAVAFHPATVRIDSGAAQGTGSLTAIVTHVTDLGHTRRASVRLESGHSIDVSLPAGGTPALGGPGQPVRLRIPPCGLRAFPR
ncbi:MAG: ABC transporter ATP-binding protein [Acidobacteriota bacterium]